MGIADGTINSFKKDETIGDHSHGDQGLCRPEGISATFYELLGIDPETEIRDKLGRPFPISKGKAIREVMA